MKLKAVSLALVLAVVSTAAAADQFVFRYRLSSPIDRLAPMVTTPAETPETPAEEPTAVWITDAPFKIDVSNGTFPPLTLHAAGGDAAYYQWEMLSAPEWLGYVQTSPEAVTLHLKPGATIPNFIGEDAIMIQVVDTKGGIGADAFIILSGKPF